MMGLPASDTQIEVHGFKIWRGNTRFLKKNVFG